MPTKLDPSDSEVSNDRDDIDVDDSTREEIEAHDSMVELGQEFQGGVSAKKRQGSSHEVTSELQGLQVVRKNSG